MKGYKLLREAKAIDATHVAVTFEDGERGVFDCAPYFSLGYYRKLNDPAFFHCAGVSFGALAWPDDIDIGADDVWDNAVRVR